MRSQTSLYVSLQPIFGVNFDRSEILDVFRFEEHVPDHSLLFVALERITRQYDSLQDNLEWVWGHD